MDLHGCLDQQEKPPEDQDQIPNRQRLPEQIEQRLGHPREPGQAQQQQDSGPAGQRQPPATRARTLLRRQAPGNDRQKDQIVDPQDDFQGRQSDQRNQGLAGE